MEKSAKKPSKVDARLIGNLAPYIGLVLVAIIFAILTKGALFTAQNVQGMIQSVMTTAICTIGAVFVFGAGYFDMSMGGSLCICAVLGTMVTISSGSLFLGAIVILAVSIVLAVIKSILGSYVNVPFFIFTIILASIFSSVVLVIMGNETTIKLSNAAKPIPELDFTGMSILSGVCLLIFFILCVIAFNYTAIGSKAKMLGGNPVAAKQSGISKTKTTFTVFIISAIAIALAAFLIMLRTRTVTNTTAGSLGNDIMVALVLGGMPLSGGPRSKISAGLVGAVTITILNSGLQIMGLNTGEVQIVRGIVFIVVVLVSSLSYRGKLLPR